MGQAVPSGFEQAGFEVHYNLQIFLELTEGSAIA